MDVPEIDPDITRARTLPAALYTRPGWFDRAVERVLARSWHAFPGALPAAAGQLCPWTLLPGAVAEPLLLSRDTDGALHCLSNVCTHRGNLLIDAPCHARGIRCGYHGRRFDLDGRFRHMPEFDDAHDFPSAADDLPRLPLERIGPLCFSSLAPAHAFELLTAPMQSRIGFVDLDALNFDPATCRDYEFDANFLLYVDNYLEGFHVPFVHPGLARELDYEAYDTELSPLGVLQVGIAQQDDAVFSPPAGHPDHGRRIAAYYFWLFPCTMLNFYPWGLSLNVVEPLGPSRTRVRFLSFVSNACDPSQRTRGAGADLHAVELEDEAIVTRVQRGVASRLYDRGRYSPTREKGVHHFHRLLCQHLAE